MTAPFKTGKTRLNAALYAMFLQELVAGPCTLPGLIEVTGLHLKTVRGLLKALHGKKLIHVSGWDNDARGAQTIAVWTWGAGRDAKRPTKTQAQVCRDWRSRQAMTAMVNASAGAA
jgi:hypothetical protein